MIWTIGLAISGNKFWKKCFYVTCYIFMQKSFLYFRKNILKTYRAIVFYICSIIFFKNRPYCCYFSMFGIFFEDISLLNILAKWQSITLAKLLTNFAEIPSGPLALFTFSDLIILLMSLVLAYGRSNVFSGTHKFLIFRVLGWLLYTEIISLTVISSWDASEEFPGDKGFLPEDSSTIFI